MARNVEYRDLSTTSKVLMVLLGGYLVLTAIDLGSDWMQSSFLEGLLAGAEVTDEGAEANDVRQFIVACIAVGGFVIVGVAFLRWIYLACRNLRALHVSGMRFTPNWAVGWYFIPFANLGMPYSVMQEIFRASHPEFFKGWSRAPRPGILPLWWTLWLVTGFTGRVSGRLMTTANSAKELLFATRVGMFSSCCGMALCVVAILLVAKLHALQEEKHAVIEAARQAPALPSPAE